MPLSILIIGNSISGPTLATFLLLSPLPATQKPHITLLERASRVRPQGQNIDIRGAGLPIIRHLGLETVIRASNTGEEGVRFVDDRDRIWASFPADRTGETKSPTADVEVMRGRLAEILDARCRDVSERVKREGGHGVEFVFGDYAEGIEQVGDGVEVKFKSGEARRFDVVVGADGLQSSTRRMVWGEEGEGDRLKRLNMFGAFFSLPWGERDTVWRRWFHASGRKGVMLRPNITEGGKSTTVFMSVVNEKDERLVQVAGRQWDGVESQKRLMAEYFQDAGWECERIVKGMMKTKDFYYDLVGQVKMDKWSKGRVVLLGDAGYCASPISGMGTTLAFNGAYHLAGALTRYPNDYTRAFEEYEEKLRPIVANAQDLPPGQPYLVNPETAWGVWVLNAVMYVLTTSGTMSVLFKYLAPQPENVVLEDYGFEELPEWEEPKNDVGTS